MELDEVCVKDIAAAINRQEYTLHQNSKRRKSDIWKIFRIIKNDSGDIVDGFICCEVCNVVLPFNSNKNGTSNLNKHRCFLRNKEIAASTTLGRCFFFLFLFLSLCKKLNCLVFFANLLYTCSPSFSEPDDRKICTIDDVFPKNWKEC